MTDTLQKEQEQEVKKLSLKDLNEDVQPRERLAKLGASALTNAELIAILMATGNTKQTAVELAADILKAASNGDLLTLARWSIGNFTRFSGVGPVKAITILAALELGRRMQSAELPKRTKITSSRDAFLAFSPHLRDLNVEEFWCACLSRSNEIIWIGSLTKGGFHATLVDPKVVFQKALEHSASGLLVAHNHPSGAASPSKADIDLTNKLIEGGKILDIQVLDHIIICADKYYSFLDEGRM